MANNKTGLNFYSIDTDRYLDIRIRRLVKDHGCRGMAVYDYLLCEVYRVQGCFVVWDENTAFNVAEYFGLKESNVSEIVKYCGAVGLFDKELLSRGIITSASIQRRYVDICNRSRRKDVKIPEECRIITEESAKITEECPKTTEVCDKESKKRKENISTSTTTARAGDDVNDFSEFPQKDCAEKYPKPDAIEYIQIWNLADWMKSHKQWLEAFCMNNHMAIDFVEKKIDEFVAHCENNGEMEKSTQDCLRHFNNWMRKEKNQVNNVKRSGKNQPPSHDDLDRAIAEGIARGRTRQEWEL